MTSDSIERIRRLYDELTDLGEDAAKRIAKTANRQSQLDTVTVLEPKRLEPKPLPKRLGSPFRLAADGWRYALVRPWRLITTGTAFVAVMTLATQAWIDARVVLDAQRVHDAVSGQIGVFLAAVFVLAVSVRAGRQAGKPGKNVRLTPGDPLAAVGIAAVAELLRSQVLFFVKLNLMSIAWIASSVTLWPLNGAYGLLVLVSLPEATLSPPDGAIVLEPFFMTLCLAPVALLSPLMTGDYKIFFKNIIWTLPRAPKILLTLLVNTIPFSLLLLIARQSVAQGLRNGPTSQVAFALSLALFLQVTVLGATLGAALRRLAEPNR